MSYIDPNELESIVYGEIVSNKPRRIGTITDPAPEKLTLLMSILDIFDRPWIVYPALIIGWAIFTTYALYLMGLVR